MFFCKLIPNGLKRVKIWNRWCRIFSSCWHRLPVSLFCFYFHRPNANISPYRVEKKHSLCLLCHISFKTNSHEICLAELDIWSIFVQLQLLIEFIYIALIWIVIHVILIVIESLLLVSESCILLKKTFFTQEFQCIFFE